MSKQQTQVLYQPVKEKVTPKPKQPPASGQQVVEYFENKLWEHRVFILTTALILSNIAWLVKYYS